MKNILKKNKAITLIALVITIVVLIILAAVAINLSIGNNGIFNRAKTAKQEYTNAQAQEELDIAKMKNQIDGHIDGNRGNITLTDEEYAQFKALVAKNSNNYSTEEKVIGTNINGKPLYQKTWTGTLGNTPSGTELIDSTFTVANGYLLEQAFGSLTYQSGSGRVAIPWYFSETNSACINQHTSGLVMARNGTGFNGSTYTITVQYTKTTD